MNEFSLTDKIILVTGATSGIGVELVSKIILQGGKVVATGRKINVLQELENQFKESIETHCFDLTLQSDLEKLAKICPKIDGMVNCSGIVKSQPIRYVSQEHLEETFSINFFSPVILVGLLNRAKKINKNASFVFISSVAAQFPRKGGTAYSCSKAALESFTKVMAMEYAHKGIRANCLAPAMIETPMYLEARELAGHDTMDEHIQRYPLGIGKPKDVADAIIFLLSDASKWMTGTIIKLDGGLLLGY